MLRLVPLKELELKLQGAQPWLPTFLADISYCSTLESLKITAGEPDIVSQSALLPDVYLNAMPNLKHVELEGWYPGHNLSLPPGCLLRLHIACGPSLVWGEGQAFESIKQHTLVLCLADLLVADWPCEIQAFERLRYLELWWGRSTEELDLARLKHIPHVRLRLYSYAELSLTSISWQSLEILAARGDFKIAFSDVSAFVRGTKEIIFSCSDSDEETHLMMESIQDACRRHGVECYVSCRQYLKDAEYDGYNYITLSTSKHLAQDCMCPLCDDDGICHGMTIYDRSTNLIESDKLWVLDKHATHRSVLSTIRKLIGAGK